ncbi:unnamed protein product [Musa acuminata subsp. malaccensis]|uniref:(wild Malaysian banana) hypothetical protein n=1 Tax=Musa acuminata subsp. malaccensis TaxID=214687 RepID=A0A804JS47_MUSAM|nr:unnamed protein product [Musa acuminata subsp. malaccensis]
MSSWQIKSSKMNHCATLWTVYILPSPCVYEVNTKFR